MSSDSKDTSDTKTTEDMSESSDTKANPPVNNQMSSSYQTEKVQPMLDSKPESGGETYMRQQISR